MKNIFLFVVLSATFLLSSACSELNIGTGDNNSSVSAGTSTGGNTGTGTGSDGNTGTGGDGNTGTGGDGNTGTGSDGNTGTGGDGNTGTSGDGNTGTGGDGNTGTGGDGNTGTGGDGNTGEVVDNSFFEPHDTELYFGRAYLSSNEQKAYDLLIKTLLSDYTDKVVCSSDMYDCRVKIDLAANNITGISTSDQIKKIAIAVTDDEPRLLHTSSQVPRPQAIGLSYTYLYDNFGNIKEFYIKIYPKYRDYSVYQADMTTINERIKTVIEPIGDPSQYTKVQLVARIQEAFLASVAYGSNGSTSTVAGDMRGAFLEKNDAKGGYYYIVCEGYARAMVHLLHRYGYKAAYIVGAAATGENGELGLHAWHRVFVNNAWYNMDSTWDDNVFSAGSTNSWKNNFMQNDSEFEVTHPRPNINVQNKPLGYKSVGIELPASAATSVPASDYE